MSGVPGNSRPIHHLAIVAMGLPPVDVMDLDAVAASRLKRWEFFVTAAPVPVLGATGFPLNPIATF